MKLQEGKIYIDRSRQMIKITKVVSELYCTGFNITLNENSYHYCENGVCPPNSLSQFDLLYEESKLAKLFYIRR